MAINTSNSNYVNISNLPQAQEAINTDLLVLQTENGTQTISFGDFNVVKTDTAGNATVVGGLTGTNAYFNVLSASGDVRSLNYYSNNQKGSFAANNYYNRFTLNGGLVTTASYALGSPEYVNITQTIIPNLTSWQNTQYRRILDLNGQTNIAFNQTYVVVQLDLFYQLYPFISSSTLNNSHFLLTTTTRISSTPFISNINTDRGTTNDLSFRINLGYAAPVSTGMVWRLFYTY